MGCRVAPAVAYHRARVSALSRCPAPDDPELVGERRSLAEARIAEFIGQTLTKYPPLSDQQRARLAELLKQ